MQTEDKKNSQKRLFHQFWIIFCQWTEVSYFLVGSICHKDLAPPASTYVNVWYTN
jgi:hypothetical protein